MVWSIYGLAPYLKGLRHSSGYLIKKDATQPSIDERAEFKGDLRVKEEPEYRTSCILWVL